MKLPKFKFSRRNKQGAMEMTMGTIVTIVLLVSVLIFGLIFTRSIMCKSILITDDITKAVQGQIEGLFETYEYGIKCVGENTDVPKIGADGGIKQIGCYFVTDTAKDYTFTINKIEKIGGTASDSEIKSWFITKEGDTVNVKLPADAKTSKTIIKLRPTANIPSTSIQVSLDVTEANSGETETHEVIFDLAKVGAFSKAIC